MKKSTRITALVLCALMFLSLLPAIAFAEENGVDFGTAEEENSESKGADALNISKELFNESEMALASVTEGSAMPYPESEHCYPDDTTDTQFYTYPGAIRLIAVFNEESTTESKYDFVYIFDGEGNQVGSYTGNFGGKSVIIPGDTMKIVLISDKYNPNNLDRYYGYSFESITAVLPQPGDVNADESVNLLDLLQLKEAMANNDFSTLNQYGVNVYEDDEINLKDLLVLKRNLADMVD